MPDLGTATVRVNIEPVFTAPVTPIASVTNGWTEMTTSDMIDDWQRFNKMNFATAPSVGPRFTALLAVEETRVTDGRMFRFGALRSRQTPLPLMFLNRNTEAHQDSVFAGNLTRIWREGNKIMGEGNFDTIENPDAVKAVRLVRDGKMNGISIDTIVTKYEFLLNEDETEMLGIDLLSAELIGATIVPFPAFSEATIQIVDEEEEREYLAAAALSPVFPTIDSVAFTLPEPDTLIPWTVTDDGMVYGHLAAWGECHNGITDRCAIAPRSKSNYANFLIGKLGDQRLGTVTMNTLHAGGGMTRAQVERHYADTGTVAAIVNITDGKLGPWVCGVLDPSLTDTDRLRLAVCGISGDWRGGELIGILACPKPGFTVPRYEDDYALVASAMNFFTADDCIGCEESRKAAEEIAEQLEAADNEVIELAEAEDLDEPTIEDLEETDNDLAADLEAVLDEVLAEIEARRANEEADKDYQRFLELVG